MDTQMHAFNYWMEAARRPLASAGCYTVPFVRATFLDMARNCVLRALGAANRLGDRRRKRLCIRVLNWLRVDLARCRAAA